MSKSLPFLLLSIIWVSICHGQQTNGNKSGSSEEFQTAEQVLEKNRAWLEQPLALHDSLILVIVNRADQDLQTSHEVRYLHSLVGTLLALRSDTAYAIILKNLFSYGFINYTNGIDVYSHRLTYPVIKAIEKVDLSQTTKIEANHLRDYIFNSTYLEHSLSDQEIGFLFQFLYLGDYEKFSQYQNWARTPPWNANIEKIKNYGNK